MLLSHILDALPSASVPPAGVAWAHVDILDIAYDSRRVTPGSLFVAVPSIGGDAASGGARFIGQAIDQGAVAVLSQSRCEIDGIPVVHVPDARAALADVAAQFFGHPSRGLELFAVTGTDGKTTTTYLLEQLFSTLGLCTGLIGTVEIKIGQERERNLERMTTPESLDVQRLLRQMVDAGVTHAAMEASSHALALDRLRCCQFAACGLTNITADHIEFHGSWEEYFQTKARLFTDLGADRPAILNADDEQCGRLAGMLSNPVLTYSQKTEANVRAIHITPDGRKTHCRIEAQGQSVPTTVPLPGRFNVSNALAAISLALTAGLGLPDVADALSQARPPPGRLEPVEAGQPFEVLVDYAHTMNAFQSVLATLRERVPTPARLIAVFGATGSRDRAKRPVLAQVARRYADFFIITDEDPYGEQPQAIIDQIASGVAADEEGNRFVRELDRGLAIVRALEWARPGDTVIILGKGHERSMVVDSQKRPWSDVDFARAVLEAMQ